MGTGYKAGKSGFRLLSLSYFRPSADVNEVHHCGAGGGFTNLGGGGGLDLIP